MFTSFNGKEISCESERKYLEKVMLTNFQGLKTERGIKILCLLNHFSENCSDVQVRNKLKDSIMISRTIKHSHASLLSVPNCTDQCHTKIQQENFLANN